MSRMPRAAATLLAIVLYLPLLVHAAVGRVPDFFKVSDSGAASYSIPIAVPPGTAGVQPHLALSYSSQSGNGLAGMGWSLSGLSTITRCPQTFATDGNSGGVDLTYNDRYCLDGQRLILVSGSYGNANSATSEYRTERDGLTKVIAYGTVGNGPQYFIAWTKAGQIIEYGNTSDSRIEASGNSTVLVWAADKVSDKSGNYLTFSYCESGNTTYCSVTPGVGEYYISRIDYTGNAAQGVAPTSSVQFVYAARTDTFTGYVGGSMISNTVRLTNVQIFEGGNSIRDYRLAYDPNQAQSSTGRSNLISLTECDSTLSTADCLPATTFTWQAGTPGFSATLSNILGSSSTGWATAKPLDFNGDGNQDLVYCGSTWQISSSVPISGGANTLNTQIASTNCQFARSIDYDGNGKVDIVVPYVNGNWYLMQSTGSTFNTPFATTTVDTGRANNLQVMDVNGDGYPDLVQAYSGNWHISLGNGNGFATETTDSTTAVTDLNAQYTKQIDFNGDGKMDLLVPHTATGDSTWHVYVSTGTGFQDINTNIPSTGYDHNPQIMDVNGDGRPDLVVSTGTTWKVYLNLGGSFSGMIDTQISNVNDTYAKLIDYNNDGKMDLLVPHTATGDAYWHVLLSTGNLTSGNIFQDVNTNLGSTNYNYNPQVMDFNGDGQADLLVVNGSTWGVYYHAGVMPDLLKTVTNGLSATTSIDYTPLTNKANKKTTTTASFPQENYKGPMYVVADYSFSNGLGSPCLTTYTYTDPQVDLRGRGFIGFGKITASDCRNITTETDYSQTFPTTGMVKAIYQSASGGGVFSSSVNTLASYQYGTANAYYYFPYVSQSVDTRYELSGSLVSTTTTLTTYHPSCASTDYYCFPTSIQTTSVAGSSTFVRTTTNTYDTPNATSWYIGHITDTTVSSTIPSGANKVRESSFSYDPTTGLLVTNVVEPNGNTGTITNIKQTTTYGYTDGFGNATSATVSGGDITARATTYAYEASSAATSAPLYAYNTGRFLTTITNALGQVEKRQYDARFGAITRLTGPNGLATQWQYDNFGRKILETRADGTTTSWTFTNCGVGTCPTNGEYYVTQTTAGAPTVITYYDMWDRELRTQTQGFNGAAVFKDTTYNSAFQIDQVSRPYYSTDTSYWTKYKFDLLNRLTDVIDQLTGTHLISTDYRGLTAVVTNDRSGTHLKTTQVKDVMGELVTVTDANNNSTNYQYDPFGNLTQVTDAKLNKTTMTYDIRGRKLTMTDPDMGYWQYAYDTLGELTQQIDAKNQTVNTTYDLLGRLKARTEAEGVSTWTYDTCTMGVGKLCTVTGYGGDQTTYAYDTLGRLSTTTSLINGTSFVMKNDYDIDSRVQKITYPTNFAVTQTYNAYGYLSTVQPSAGGTPYWTGNNATADGQISSETLGNTLITVRQYDPDTGNIIGISTGFGSGSTIQNLTYQYDTLGNLTQRSDYNQPTPPLNETFAYDNLNRLTTVTRAGTVTKTYQYDAIGNITNKSDVGNYSYGATTQPHAVLTAGSNSYTYDANGNLKTGAGRTLTYTSFNMLAQVGQSGVSDTYTYGADHMRNTETEVNNGVTTNTVYINPRIDLGGHFEQETSGGVVTSKHYIYVGSRVVALYTSRSTGVNDTRYLHQDHLGSTDTITDETGTIKEKLSYDPSGKRRNPDWTAATTYLTSAVTHHGFTAHEHMDEVALINMNARIYDPTLGRFLSPDPEVEYAASTQGLNRYSYVNNNPLSFTDMSGNDDGFDGGSFDGGLPCMGDCYPVSGGIDLGNLFGNGGYGGCGGGGVCLVGGGGSTGSSGNNYIPIPQPGPFFPGNGGITGDGQTGGTGGSTSPGGNGIPSTPRVSPPPAAPFSPPLSPAAAERVNAGLSGSMYANLSNLANTAVGLIPGGTFSANGEVSLKAGNYPMAAVYYAGMVADEGLAVVTGDASAGIEADVRATLQEAESFVAKSITNPVSDTLARVVPGHINPTTLGRTGDADVFVTNASELQGLTAKEIAKKLAIPESASGFKVIEFPSADVSGIASPVFRTNPGFVGGGRTAGGASEFVIPNGPIPAGAVQRVVP